MSDIIILSAHPDDAELGCGGSIAKWVEQGNDVYNYIFTKSELSKKEKLIEESVRAGILLRMRQRFISGCSHRNLFKDRQRILDILIKIRIKHNPDTVCCPSLNDAHQDHCVLAREAVRAFKFGTLLSYESCWNNLDFKTQAFIELEKKHVEKKQKAVECYQSWKDKDYLNPAIIWDIARVRGLQGGTEYAEVFEVIRLRL